MISLGIQTFVYPAVNARYKMRTSKTAKAKKEMMLITNLDIFKYLLFKKDG